MPKKCILILLDGLGDRSHQVLDNLTPLQAAHTPNLDKIAATGANGLYHATVLGQALPSENAHFTMFGYDMEDFPGRGALEAIGAGVDLSPTDVALLSHFVSLSETNNHLLLEIGKPEAEPDEVESLTESIKTYSCNNVDIIFHPTGGIRGILTLSGNVSPYVTDSDPFIDGRPLVAIQPWQDCKKDRAAQNTADVLSSYLRWVYDVLRRHEVNNIRKQSGKPPLNGLSTQRAGRLKQVTPFVKKYGLRGVSMSSGMIYWGLGEYIGMDVVKVSDTGNPGADMEERLNMAKASLSDYDFVHVHTKTPDEAAHTKNPVHKKTVIESLDAGIGRALESILHDPDILVIVTADHSTPSTGPLIHSGESVPLLIHGSGIRRDRVERLDEVSAAEGALGSVRGKELMYLVLNHLDRAKLAGIMDTPEDQPYWPGNYEPFTLIKN